MFEHRTPPAILLGAFGLTACAGMVNTVGFLGAYHQAFSHLSGTGTFFAVDLVRGEFLLAAQAFGLLLAFFVGATLSGLLIRDAHLRLGRRYGAALLLEAVLLVTAAHRLNLGHLDGAGFAAAACGLQNAMATTYSGAIVRTTHITGIVTDLGLAFSHWVRRAPGRGGRTRLLGTLLGGFLIGAASGAAIFPRLSYDTLLLPALGCALGGVGCVLTRRFTRAT